MSDRRTAPARAASCPPEYSERSYSPSFPRLPCIQRPGWSDTVGREVDIRCANGHSDLDGGGVDVAELAEHPNTLFEFDERDHERQRAPRNLRRMVHDEA